MGLLEDISEEQSKTTQNRCAIARLPQKLDAGDLKDLEVAMADESIRHVAIARALRARGLQISDNAVSAHRKGMCACARG